MSRFLPLLLLGLLLSGCYSDQKQQLGECDLQAQQQSKDTVDYISLCMRAHGYEVVQDDCPKEGLLRYTLPKVDPEFFSSLSQEQKRSFSIERSKDLEIIERLATLEPACYEPMGWFGKRFLKLEKEWFGTPN
jgi:hypothetical protein